MNGCKDSHVGSFLEGGRGGGVQDFFKVVIYQFVKKW